MRGLDGREEEGVGGQEGEEGGSDGADSCLVSVLSGHRLSGDDGMEDGRTERESTDDAAAAESLTTLLTLRRFHSHTIHPFKSKLNKVLLLPLSEPRSRLLIMQQPQSALPGGYAIRSGSLS